MNSLGYRLRYIEVLICVAKCLWQPLLKRCEVRFPPEPRLDIKIAAEALPFRDGRRTMQLELEGRVLLDPLQRRHLFLSIDLNYGPVWLIDAQKEVDHALPERVLEVVVVVATDRRDQFGD